MDNPDNPVHNLINTLSALPGTHGTLLVAIDGRGGSGKSTLASAILRGWSNATVVHLDDFATPSGEIDRQRLLAQVILPLRQNREAHYERYDWATSRLAESHTIVPGGVVIVEGVGTLFDLLVHHYDYKIWIACPADIGFQCGLMRDKNAYGVDTTDSWLNEWLPKEQRYIEEQQPQDRADIIVDYASL